MKRKLFGWTAALLTVWTWCSSLQILGAEEPSLVTVALSEVQDVMKLAEHCADDIWSKNKRVVLTKDIDMTGVEFAGIPLFAGVFEGNGHAVTGLQMNGSEDVTGFFRYIGVTGVVKNFVVRGQFQQEGNRAGGICGVNYGTIEHCTFEGTIVGNGIIGGVCGVNEAGASVEGCVSRGRIRGFYTTGGVVGENHGEITNCTNEANVNEDQEWVASDDAQGAGLFFNLRLENDRPKLLSGTDTGGVAGYSEGDMSGCINRGSVGYEHAGYNVGGIVGRQTGVVENCVNEGEVSGKKAVGGIAGQQEPYIEVQEGATLQGEMNRLHTLINQTLEHMQGSKHLLHGHMSALQSYGDKALDSADKVSDSLTEFTNENIGQANELAGQLDALTEQLPTVLEELYTAGEELLHLQNRMDAAFSRLEAAAADGEWASAKEQLLENGKLLRQDLEKISRIREEIKSIMTTSEGTVRWWTDLTPEEQQRVKQLLWELEETLALAGQHAAWLSAAVEEVMEAGISFAEEGAAVPEEFKGCSEDAKNIINALQRANENAQNILSYLNSQPEVQFTPTGNALTDAKGELYSQLKEISAIVKVLNDDASAQSDILTADLKAVNDQLNVVFNLLADILTADDDASIESFFEDVDAEHLEQIERSRISGCENKGVIGGDTNVGGIAGAMSIEAQESENNAITDLKLQIGSRYITKCLIIGCRNSGFVYGKKDNVGGIAGEMKHGIIAECEGYGKIESSEGDNVGGIAGSSKGWIIGSYGLSALKGGKNVGGIAGVGDNLRECVSMVHVMSAQGKKGAVAGSLWDSAAEAAATKAVYQNVYVSETLEGIDNIGYEGGAEKITYEALLEREELPWEFSHLKVYFLEEDRCVGTQEVAYGASLSNLKYPQITEREGVRGAWPDVSDETMEGVRYLQVDYRENVSVLADGTWQADETKPLGLLEGDFSNGEQFQVRVSRQAPPQAAADVQNIMYEVTFPAQRQYSLRLFNLYQKASLYAQNAAGEWSALPFEMQGSYLELSVDGTEKRFCIAEQKSTLPRQILMYTGVGAAVIFSGMTARKIWKRRASEKKALTSKQNQRKK